VLAICCWVRRTREILTFVDGCGSSTISSCSSSSSSSDVIGGGGRGCDGGSVRGSSDDGVDS